MLLTLAIPTYNRREIVVDKVEFLLDVLRNSPLIEDCELLIVDNASADGTYEKLCTVSSENNHLVKVFKNQQNIGLVANCLRCIELATGKYVWIIGDDDPIQGELFEEIYTILYDLKADINLLHLNHNCIDKTNGPVLIESFYGTIATEFSIDGKTLFNKLISGNHTGGFMFITASILHKEKAQKLLSQTNSRYKKMLGFPMFLNSYLALTGSLVSPHLSNLIHKIGNSMVFR